MKQQNDNPLPVTPPVTEAPGRRPIPVFIIAAACVLQYIGIVSFTCQNWSEVLEPVGMGQESMVEFAGKFLYPTILFFAGVSLLRMKKIAVHLFVLYLAIGVARIIAQPMIFAPYLSLAVLTGVTVYCYRLRQQALLT
ncbi:hypothetical protein [Burkholderia ubonensis]|uniref:hypothetical protein n=1 Tax=Burkholderia ubonensis TaxID=101571 RepID=UPI000B05A967|nr:hypothetical protein [Burkholderia ubonensis]